ncbi:response regulator transcription factor [Micrococcaceae bacterium Sec5.7]
MDEEAKPRVLLIEDDDQLGPLTVQLLGGEFNVTLATDGQQGLHLGLTGDWDVLVIDRGLPLLDGASLIAALRRKQVSTPVLILTALGAVQDKIDGLDAGANDYMVKPFDADELAARLRALTRTYDSPRTMLPLGSWDFDPSGRIMSSAYGARVVLSPRESGLLELLARNPGRVFSRPELLTAVFEGTDGPSVVDTYVHYLRKKVGKSVILTIHGAGYRIGEPQ